MGNTFPVRVIIDDKCDACGMTDRKGVAYGPGKPVLCAHCLQEGVNAVLEGLGWTRLGRRMPPTETDDAHTPPVEERPSLVLRISRDGMHFSHGEPPREANFPDPKNSGDDGD